MSLKLTLEENDIALLSGGVVLLVDEIEAVNNTTEITIAQHNGNELTHKIVKAGIDENFMCGASECRIVDVRRLHKKGTLSVQIAFFAPREVVIQRFHEFQSDGELRRILSRFEDKDELVKVLAALEYYKES